MPRGIFSIRYIRGAYTGGMYGANICGSYFRNMRWAHTSVAIPGAVPGAVLGYTLGAPFGACLGVY